MTLLDGVDTVEVSKVDLTFLGHGYYAEARTLLNDMYLLLRHNQLPPRIGLDKTPAEGGGTYWVIRG